MNQVPLNHTEKSQPEELRELKEKMKRMFVSMDSMKKEINQLKSKVHSLEEEKNYNPKRYSKGTVKNSLFYDHFLLSSPFKFKNNLKSLIFKHFFFF